MSVERASSSGYSCIHISGVIFLLGLRSIDGNARLLPQFSVKGSESTN